MRTTLVCLITIVTLAAVTNRAAACWAAIDPTAYAERCPVIVTGTITKVVPAKGDKERDDDLAHITMSAVHKNLLKDVTAEVNGEIVVRMASFTNKLRCSTDINYPVGTTAVWLIALSDDGTLRIDRHPVQRQPLPKEKDKARELPFRPRELVTIGKDGKPLVRTYTKAEWIARQMQKDRADEKHSEAKDEERSPKGVRP